MKRILIILSEYGYWGEELLGPLEAFDEAGYQVDFATPTGKRPHAAAAEHGPRLRRPAARPVGDHAGGRRKPPRSSDASDRLDKPISLAELVPGAAVLERADFAAATWRRYYRELDDARARTSRSTTRSCSSAAAARSSTWPTTTGCTT